MHKSNKFVPILFTLLALSAVALMLFLLLQFPEKAEIAVGSAMQQEQPATATPPVDSPLDTPTPFPMPEITATPMPTLPSVDELESGLKLVYAEIDESRTQTAIRIANIANLEKSKHLVTFKHRFGYWAQGSVSPDGKWIAIKLIPPNMGDRGARMYGGELWLMKSDGTDLHQLPTRTRGIIGWSPQGEVTIESGVDIVNPTMPEDSVRPEYYAITPDGEVTKIMGPMLDNVATNPVGWSADGTEFYYTWRDMGVGDLALGSWELRSISRKDGTVRSVMKAPYKAAEHPSLLASRTRLTYLAYTETEQLQVVSDISGENAIVLTQAPRNEDSQYWLWSILSSTKELILQRAVPLSTDQAELLQVDLSTEKIETQTIGKTDRAFVPISWSPDEKWAVLRKTPLDDTSTTILQLESGELVEIPKANPSNPIRIFGWVSNS